VNVLRVEDLGDFANAMLHVGCRAIS